MFRIAVCGGEPHELETIRSLLDKYCETRNDIDIRTFFFDTADKLQHEIADGKTYNLYVLDVLEPGLDGIELAKKIRATGSNAQFVFTGPSSEYAIEAFSVYAMQYFLKPVQETDFFTLLDIVFTVTGNAGNKVFQFPSSNSVLKIPFNEIVYIEILGHKMTAYLRNGDEVVSKSLRTTFQEAIKPLLNDDRFLQVHRSFAVNMEHVQEVAEYKFIMTNGSSIPVPRYKYTEARAKCYEWQSQHGIIVSADKKVKTGKAARRMAAVSLIVLLIVTAILNLSPKLSAAAYEIPVVGDIVRVLTFNRFAYKDKGYSAEVNVPQIRGLLDAELEERLNAEFRDYADDLILSFEDAVIEIAELGVDVEETSGEPAHMSIKADYEVKTDNDRVLVIDAYLYSEVNGLELHKYYTIDKKAGKQISLSDLFKPDADYITPISEYLTGEMERINRDENGAFMLIDTPDIPGYFHAIKADNYFYVNDKGELVICFDKYEVAAGFMGNPEVVIPIEVIADMLSTTLIE